MASLPAPRPFTQRKPPPPVEVTGRLVTGEGLQDLFREAAVLSVFKGGAEQLYWCGAITDAGRIVGLRLVKFGTGEKYHVYPDPESGAWACDCPDCTYRQRDCKHILALHDAFTNPTE